MTLQIIFRSILVTTSLSLIHCAELQKSTAQKTTHPSLTEKTQFESHPDWLALNLNPAGYIKLLQKIKTKRNLELKSRGEAHITLLTPPEFKSFQGQIPMSEIEAATKPILEKATFEVLCLGSGKLKSQTPEAQATFETFFVVVQSKDLLEIRKVIYGLAQKHNVAKNFNPEDYYPHVTIGFTVRDLHQADGVIKDKGTCQADLDSDLNSVLKD